MKFESILFEEKESVAWVTINRPQAMNALNSQVMSELDVVVKEISKSETLRALVITGSGEKAFVAGADIKEIDPLSFQTAHVFAEFGHRVFNLIEHLPFPTIAMVNGFALGGGLELALACDFIIASKNAKFALPECSLGIMPGYGGTVRLPRRIPVGYAREMALTGAMISSEEALRLGLVNRVVELGELKNTVDGILKTVVSRAPIALRKIKESMSRGLEMSQTQHGVFEIQLFTELFKTEDQKEGTQAFIAKRPPQFKGK